MATDLAAELALALELADIADAITLPRYTNRTFKPSGSIAVEECDTGGDTEDCNGDGNNNDKNNNDKKCHAPQCGDGYINASFTPADAVRPEECEIGQPCTGNRMCNHCNCVDR